MDKVMAQLEGLVAHYEELQEMMADPEVDVYKRQSFSSY